MKPTYVEFPTGDCAEVGAILSRVGDKWTVLVVVALANGSLRFTEIKRLIGHISQKMLTVMRNFERDGFVSRTVTPAIPPRVDYALTELGMALLQPVGAMAEWVVQNRLQIRAARNGFDSVKPASVEAQ